MASRPTITVHRLSPEGVADFHRLHSDEQGAGWCHCVAWWVPSWEGWQDRTAEQNRALRARLFEEGQYDGYLLYCDDQPTGWCQCGPRDRLPNLVREFGQAPDANVWAVTCLLIVPAHRKRGLVRKFLAAVLDDLRARGVSAVEAYPRPSQGLQDCEVWTGPEQVFVDAGFALVRDAGRRRIYVKHL